MPPVERFDLDATVKLVANAFGAIVCTIGFQAAVHGLCVALVICTIAFFNMRHNGKVARPLFAVFKKMTIFCFVLGLPGSVALMTQGKLPQVNALELNSFGLLGFWALVTAHLCMEEMNFQFFDPKEQEAKFVPVSAPEFEEQRVVPAPSAVSAPKVATVQPAASAEIVMSAPVIANSPAVTSTVEEKQPAATI